MYILFEKVGVTMAESIPSTPLEPAIPIVPSTPLEPAKANPWNYTEIPNFYDRVRSALNVGTAIISNEMIDYFENAPMAESKMRKQVPIWRDLDEFKTSLFQTCIIYMTCYQLCPIVSSQGKLTEQTTPSLTLKYATNTKTNDKPCERFLALIDDLVSEILDKEMELFFGFKVTKEYPECGCRQVWDGWNKNAFIPL